VVEAFVQGGRTSYVSADTPFAAANSSVHVFNSGAQLVVVRSLEVYTMGCGWSSTLPAPRTTLKSDDGEGEERARRGGGTDRPTGPTALVLVGVGSERGFAPPGERGRLEVPMYCSIGC
jgi:hypothetical protein